jgi:hypothetical protein
MMPNNVTAKQEIMGFSRISSLVGEWGILPVDLFKETQARHHWADGG